MFTSGTRNDSLWKRRENNKLYQCRSTKESLQPEHKLAKMLKKKATFQVKLSSND